MNMVSTETGNPGRNVTNDTGNGKIIDREQLAKRIKECYEQLGNFSNFVLKFYKIFCQASRAPFHKQCS